MSVNKESLMDEIIERIAVCTRCGLCQNRTQTVPGEGSLGAKIFFVGEAPGREEDLSGRPFVGAAGKLFTTILKAVDIAREEVYIGNIIKCRPPENRTPTMEEMKACAPFLLAQLQVVQPRLIVTLGASSLSFFLSGREIKITEMRGKYQQWEGGIPIFPMFHPSYLLRNASKAPGSPKALTWSDIQEVRRVYEQSE
ncbi:MAG TPA: uracil-DNA glycosylase [Thermotogota bacterium]|jgi:DNA polymerase|nr:uracil-DNA glycosylase [Thermotogota bacterium]MDD8053435.1 uracil-DNA glycosylase [Thermotogota bacterium]NLZ14677.1 uracil-DNA glycosylase [Thermotogaceae bacterium]HOZ11768.1 uracil-DNA glycosylase [Thermotogota bacterium]HPE41695.1 uracil-DNA glycosylase [Thermotogota bacterium]